MIDYDLELRRHHAAFRRALDIELRAQVLDIGCGSGETTRDAARTASAGGALGIDRSDEMIQRARALTLAERVENASFVCADVERYAFPPRHFELAISRFGTMFFADPIAAFTQIHAALRPQGQLVMIVWQGREQNEWAVEISRALAGDCQSPAAWQPFSLGDSSVVLHILQAAGFTGVRLDAVHEPVFYGADTGHALAFVSQFLLVQDTLNALHERAREHAQDRLRALLESRRTSDGVWFDSEAWIVSARATRTG